VARSNLPRLRASEERLRPIAGYSQQDRPRIVGVPSTSLKLGMLSAILRRRSRLALDRLPRVWIFCVSATGPPGSIHNKPALV